MTPIKTIILHGTMILCRDMADNVELKAVATNRRDADWLASSLAAHHKVEVEHWDTQVIAARVTS